LRISSGERVRDVRLEREEAVLDGERVGFRIHENGAAGDVIETGGRRHRVRAVRGGDRVFVWCDGQVYEFGRARGPDRGADRGDLRAPMPGRIRKNFVSAGEAVKRGQVLLILEAMKMEHAIRAPRDGAVRRVPHAEGDLVEAGTVLVELGEGSPAG